MGNAQLYFWSAGAYGIHALSPLAHRVLGQIAIPDSPAAAKQTGHHGIDAAGFLPQPLWAFLQDWLNPTTMDYPVLLLDRSLPEGWHTFPWETLNWRGEKLGARLRVIRYAHVAEHAPSRSGASLIWDQWPEADFEPIWARTEITRRSKREQIEQDVADGTNLGHFDRLVVIAHGGKGDTACLQDRSGQAWDMPLPATLPPEVLILACASYQGNFHDLAVNCLKRGAQSVICGHGQLNAQLMAGFLENWLQHNAETHHHPYQLLWDLQQQTTNERGGVHWLRYYGAVWLNCYDKLTLDFFQQPLRPNPVAVLSKAINDDNPTAIKAFIQAAKKSANAWPLTRYWLLPVALYWAEKEDHAAISPLKKQASGLTLNCQELLPERAYGLAAIHRRRGDYPLAVRQLAEGLHAAPDARQAINLLGSLLNDLIDLNLPKAGEAVCLRLDCVLATVDDDQQKFRLLDRKARLVLRLSKLDEALVHWRTKRRQAIELEHSGNRELASLLYTSAWAATPEADTLAKTALARLPKDLKFTDGNDDCAYLLRALSAWQWRMKPGQDCLAAYLPACREQLISPDPGPYAYVLFFHGLATDNSQERRAAATALERGRYWLELAVFHALANDWPNAERALGQFQTSRDHCILQLTQASLYDIDWQSQAQEQTRLERECLLTGNVNVERLIQQGLLPL